MNDIEIRSEIWHGDRFAELSYFWDENKLTLLPTVCPNCKEIIKASWIQSTRPHGVQEEAEFIVTCSECEHQFLHKPKFMRGCPLNQAYILHEDGFNAFLTATRGTAAIHLSNACVKKTVRMKQDFVKTYSFIPTTHIKEGIPHKLDAFFEPLIEEVTDLYINGRTVTLENPVDIGNYLIPAGNHQVRALILLGTADIKAHQELVLYASGKCKKNIIKYIFKVVNYR